MSRTWSEFSDELERRLRELGLGGFLTVAYELPPEEQEWTVRRGLLGRRRERVPSPREFFAQALVLDKDHVAAECTGSTRVGGHHPVDDAGHREILALGWKEPTDPDSSGAAGLYTGYWPRADAGGLAAAVAGALELLGASPGLDWTWREG